MVDCIPLATSQKNVSVYQLQKMFRLASIKPPRLSNKLRCDAQAHARRRHPGTFFFVGVKRWVVVKSVGNGLEEQAMVDARDWPVQLLRGLSSSPLQARRVLLFLLGNAPVAARKLVKRCAMFSYLSNAHCTPRKTSAQTRPADLLFIRHFSFPANSNVGMQNAAYFGVLGAPYEYSQTASEIRRNYSVLRTV